MSQDVINENRCAKCRSSKNQTILFDIKMKLIDDFLKGKISADEWVKRKEEKKDTDNIHYCLNCLKQVFNERKIPFMIRKVKYDYEINDRRIKGEVTYFIYLNPINQPSCTLHDDTEKGFLKNIEETMLLLQQHLSTFQRIIKDENLPEKFLEDKDG